MMMPSLSKNTVKKHKATKKKCNKNIFHSQVQKGTTQDDDAQPFNRRVGHKEDVSIQYLFSTKKNLHSQV